MSDPMDAVVWVVLAAIGLYSRRHWFQQRAKRARARRALEARPALTETTSDGEVVRVTGVVRAIETVTASLSGRECVVFRVVVGSWREEFAIRPFMLERESGGGVLVDGSHAVLDLPPATEFDVVPREQFVLRHHGMKLRDASMSRFEEFTVELGATITVSGLVMKDAGTDAPATERYFRDAPAPALRIMGNAEHPLLIGRPARKV